MAVSIQNGLIFKKGSILDRSFFNIRPTRVGIHNGVEGNLQSGTINGIASLIAGTSVLLECSKLRAGD